MTLTRLPYILQRYTDIPDQWKDAVKSVEIPWGRKKWGKKTNQITSSVTVVLATGSQFLCDFQEIVVIVFVEKAKGTTKI